eukprot:TRINITY_DN4671_c0_g2_i1.p1 TRINITY_DN4671_c0_g2~~TRINITY_DN4671_c0_g2_i1.p1  ORF type:complete len:366 (-),score=85.05 TRINITY_DN4671_c0_g2_i1:227-1324(-)
MDGRSGPRVKYTSAEDKAIVGWVQRNRHYRVQGKALWEIAESLGLTRHSWQSMRNRWIKVLSGNRCATKRLCVVTTVPSRPLRTQPLAVDMDSVLNIDVGDLANQVTTPTLAAMRASATAIEKALTKGSRPDVAAEERQVRRKTLREATPPSTIAAALSTMTRVTSPVRSQQPPQSTIAAALSTMTRCQGSFSCADMKGFASVGNETGAVPAGAGAVVDAVGSKTVAGKVAHSPEQQQRASLASLPVPSERPRSLEPLASLQKSVARRAGAVSSIDGSEIASDVVDEKTAMKVTFASPSVWPAVEEQCVPTATETAATVESQCISDGSVFRADEFFSPGLLQRMPAWLQRIQCVREIPELMLEGK